ncbi:Ada metal-binding domain-containing protein, partial [Bacillus mobilis]
MHNEGVTLTNEHWQAIIHNDSSYDSKFFYAVKKGYSGTAIFTKKEPLSVTYGLGIEEHDQEGRVITVEFE